MISESPLRWGDQTGTANSNNGLMKVNKVISADYNQIYLASDSLSLLQSKLDFPISNLRENNTKIPFSVGLMPQTEYHQ